MVKNVKESAIEDYLVDKCKKLGIPVRKVIWSGRRNAPDRLLMVNGGIWVETKRPDKSYKLTPGQVREHEVMRNAGMVVYCAYNKEDVDNIFNSIGE